MRSIDDFKLVLVLFLLLPTLSIAKNIASLCDYKESSVTSCLQKEIYNSAKLHKTLILKPGNYSLTEPLLLSNNVSINGNRAVFNLNYSKPNQAAFYGESITNVSILNLKINGNGYYTESKIINPYGDPKRPFAIGFSNTNNGIAIYGRSANITIKDVGFTNLHHGIYLDAVVANNYLSRMESVIITNSVFTNLGKAAIFIRNVSGVTIENNNITNVSGNFASGLMPDIKSTAWADGIYVRGLQDGIIESNMISSIRRIAIVLEGETNISGVPITLNDNVTIRNNIISNLFGSRGTEYNAGIWVEPYNNTTNTKYYKSQKIIIDHNNIDNKFAVSGSHSQWGIRLGALNNTVTKNTIANFNGAGIVYSYGHNDIESNFFINVKNKFLQGGDNKKLSNVNFMNNISN